MCLLSWFQSVDMNLEGLEAIFEHLAVVNQREGRLVFEQSIDSRQLRGESEANRLDGILEVHRQQHVATLRVRLQQAVDRMLGSAEPHSDRVVAGLGLDGGRQDGGAVVEPPGSPGPPSSTTPSPRSTGPASPESDE